MKTIDIIQSAFEKVLIEKDIPNSILMSTSAKEKLNVDYVMNFRVYHSSLFDPEKFVIGKFEDDGLRLIERNSDEKGKLTEFYAIYVKSQISGI